MSSVFSEYELDQWGVKFEDDEAATIIECVGSCEEEMNVKVISKKCRGVVKKKRVKGDGTGVYKITAHIPYDVFNNFYGMTLDTLISGVKAYGQNSRHKVFCTTMHVVDEDGVEKYKAYPNCIVETGITRKIENGAEEVAEIEMEVNVMPDDYGNGLYEVLAAELTDESLKTKWMTAFDPALVQIESA